MRDDRLSLRHVVDAIDSIDNYTDGVPREEFLASRILQDAVVRQLGILGESVKNLSEETRDSHPQVVWDQIIGMRNRLTHVYFKVDTELVWEIIKTDLPVLRQSITEILGQ